MKRILIAALAVLGAVSCAKETVGPESDVYTIDAFIENVSTRTQIVDNSGSFSLEWSDGDSFSLFDGASLLTFSRVGGTSRFTSATAPAAAEKYYAYYPGNAVNSAADGRFTVTLPSEIDYTEGNITAGQFPMSGVSTETGVSFRNLCALVSFTVNADAADRNRKLKTITLAATKAICGEATVNFGADELSVTGDGRSVSINCNGLSLDEARTFHFTVPTGEYDTLLVRFETQDSGYGEVLLKGPFKFKRSVDYSATMNLKLYSPFITTVIDVDFAPGQFINTLPANLMTKESAIAACSDVIVGKTSSYIHLGGWGGSVTVGFDHPILNLEGSDFRGYGNAFEGSSEPGVYYVAQKGADGNPEKWYLIRHSMYDYSIHDYTITYYKPAEETQTQYKFFAWKGDYATKTTSVVATIFKKNGKEIESKDPDAEKWYLYNDNIYKEGEGSTKTLMKLIMANTVTSTATSEADVPATYESFPVVYSYTKTVEAFDNYIYWEDNLGHNGYENKNSYHKQSYWPEYAGNTITITGEYLPNISFDTSGNGTNYVQDAKWWGFPLNDKGWGQGAYGYVDCYPNSHACSTIDIDWAVDGNGNAVHLDHIDFVKVQSGVHKQSGWIGEISTEFCGIEDLHMKGEKVTVDTSVTPDINSIPNSGDALQPAGGLLFWPYAHVERPSWLN